MLAAVKRSPRGISLVEVMVVVAALGILLAVAVPSFVDLLNKRRVEAVAAEISSDLALARAETTLRPQALALYFKQDSTMSCYSMGYFGGLGSCNCTQGPSQRCNGSVAEFKTSQTPQRLGVSYVATGTWAPLADGRVNFQAPLLTSSVPNFAVNVVGIRGFTLRVQLNEMGRVSTCTPDGSMTGVARCPTN